MEASARETLLHRRVIGSGDPILYIHGFPVDGSMWEDAARLVHDQRPGWMHIIPDLPGFGRTPAREGLTIGQCADALAGVLGEGTEARGGGGTEGGWSDAGRGAVVVGLSMGGVVALDLFRRHRGLVRALVLCDCRAEPETPEGAAHRDEVARLAERGPAGVAEVVDGMLPKVFAPGFAGAGRWRAVMAASSPAGVAAMARALAARPDSRPLLGGIDVPTLVLVGEMDEITPPEQMRAMHQAIPGSRFAVVPGSGHVPPVERPGAFAAELAAFLGGLGGGSPGGSL
jgi:3-oxoadipate enol-lactonase